jgi:hypothetical protein
VDAYSSGTSSERAASKFVSSLTMPHGTSLAVSGRLRDKEVAAGNGARIRALFFFDVPEMGAHGYPEIQGPATLVHAMGASMPKAPAMTMAIERSR